MRADLAQAITDRRLSYELRATGIKVDRTGTRSGRLFILSFSHRERGRPHWVAACICGAIKTVSGSPLPRSCGCLKDDVSAATCRRRSTHGMSKSRLSQIHSSMKLRCHNPNAINYARYGGKGIRVCEEWLTDRWSFFKWALANGYEDGLEIDRIDNSKGYEPSNCRWVTSTENQNNRSNNRRITINGITKTLAQWALDNDLHLSTICRRIKAGWTEEAALTTPSQKPWLTAIAHNNKGTKSQSSD